MEALQEPAPNWPHRFKTRHFLLLEQPNQESQGHTDQQARDDRKMKAEVAFRIMDVSRHSPQPSLAKTGPDQQADESDHQADDKQHLARFIHDILANWNTSPPA